MKHLLISTAAVGALFLTGCASSVPVGSIYTDISLPVAVTEEQGGAKRGVASCKSYLAMLATGDCSIEAAKKNGGIVEVTHVDWQANNILGLVGTYTLIVYGN